MSVRTEAVDPRQTETANDRLNASLPLRTLTVVLEKAAVGLREPYRLKPYKSRDADIVALTTLSSVCRRWWYTIDGPKWSKRRQRRLFRFRPQLSARLLADNSDEYSVAFLNDHIYIVSYSFGSVRVFHVDRRNGEAQPPSDVRLDSDQIAALKAGFHQLDEVHVRGLKYPTDIVACHRSNQLFLVDSRQVWKIKVVVGEEQNATTSNSAGSENKVNFCVDKLIRTACKQCTLSIRDGRLLITPCGGGTLYLYALDGEPIRQIQLPSHVYARHAVQTMHRTYLVCHTGWTDTVHDQVSEVDWNGRILRTYGGRRGPLKHQLNTPKHIVLISVKAAENGTNSNGSEIKMLVVDYFNNRVVLLNEKLEFERVLLDNKRDKLKSCPHRLCYDGQSSQLFVGFDGGGVHVYKWTYS